MAKVLEIDATTNIAVERNETAEEKALRDASHEIYLADIEAQAAKQIAREALLTRLGITAAEAQLLLGA